MTSFSQGYVQLYFIPVGKCYANRPQRSDEDNKDFKINLSFLWIMHVAMVRLGYPYVILLEDDMAPGPDFYLHHVALSHVALADPSVVAVMASNAGIYYDCMGPLRAHLLATSHEHDPNAVYYANEVQCLWHGLQSADSHWHINDGRYWSPGGR